MENVIVTPHVAGQSTVYVDMALPVLVHNMTAFLAGQPYDMRNRVDRAGPSNFAKSPDLRRQRFGIAPDCSRRAHQNSQARSMLTGSLASWPASSTSPGER